MSNCTCNKLSHGDIIRMDKNHKCLVCRKDWGFDAPTVLDNKNKLNMNNKLYTESIEHYKNQPKDHSNAIMIVDLASLFIFCGVVLYVVSLVERVMMVN